MYWTPNESKMIKVKALSNAIHLLTNDLLTSKTGDAKVTLMLESLRAQRQELLKSMGPLKEVK